MTGRGKIVRRRSGKQHLLAKKNNKRKLRLSKMVGFLSTKDLLLRFCFFLQTTIFFFQLGSMLILHVFEGYYSFVCVKCVQLFKLRQLVISGFS